MVNEVVLWDEDVKAFKKLLFDKQLNHPEEVTWLPCHRLTPKFVEHFVVILDNSNAQKFYLEIEKVFNTIDYVRRFVKFEIGVAQISSGHYASLRVLEK